VLNSGLRALHLPAAARSPRSWLAAMTLVGVVGGALAISQATKTHWQVQMPLSRLGVDTGSAGILTFTLVGLGIILLALGIALDRAFAGLRAAGRMDPSTEWLLTAGFVVAGVAMAVTGVFPIQGSASTTIHNLAGFTIPIALMATMIGARLALGSLGRQFDRWSAVVSLSVIVLFAATHWAHLLPYGLMELICFVLIGAWLWFFEARLRWLLAHL
jgi:hypothetical protein